MTVSEFKREARYIVIKLSDLNKLRGTQTEALRQELATVSRRLPKRECVVVESDWPEYHFVWLMLEHRMAGYPVPDFNAVKCAADVQAAQSELAALREENKKVQKRYEDMTDRAVEFEAAAESAELGLQREAALREELTAIKTDLDKGDWKAEAIQRYAWLKEVSAQRDDLSQRLTAAEQRNSDLIDLIRKAHTWVDRNNCGGWDAYELRDQLEAALTAPIVERQPVDDFQYRVKPWLLDCFGEKIASDKQERNHRFLEEALELVQACGATAGEAHQLVDYVYGRDIGDPAQEVGGVMVTLAALCLAHDLDMHEAGETELARIWKKVEQIRAKQAAKPNMSPLPGAYPDRASPPAPVAVVLPERLTDAELEELEVIEVLLHGQGLSNLAGTVAAARQFIDEIVCLYAPAQTLRLPERKPIEALAFNWTTADVENAGWNACLDKVKEMNQSEAKMCDCNQGRIPCTCK